MSLKHTNRLQRIVTMYCTDYKRFITEDENDLIAARFKSYQYLIQQYPIDNAYKLITEMSNEVRVLSVTSRDNMRVLLYKMFEIINTELESRPTLKINSVEDFEHAYLYQVYDMINYVTETIKQLIRELSPIKKANQRRVIKPSITTFNEVVISPENLSVIYQTLIERNVIDEQHLLIKPANRLYGIIKRFKKLGYFHHKTTYETLHLLVNNAFKCDKSIQQFKQSNICKEALPPLS